MWASVELIGGSNEKINKVKTQHIKFSIKTLLSRVQKLQRKRRFAHHDTAVADEGRRG